MSSHSSDGLQADKTTGIKCVASRDGNNPAKCAGNISRPDASTGQHGTVAVVPVGIENGLDIFGRFAERMISPRQVYCIRQSHGNWMVAIFK